MNFLCLPLPPHSLPPGAVGREPQLCPQPGAGTGMVLWLFAAAQVPTWSRPPAYPG